MGLEIELIDGVNIISGSFTAIEVIEVNQIEPGAEIIEINQVGASVEGVEAVQALINGATSQFDTLGEVEQQVRAISTSLQATQAQVASLEDAPNFTQYFENALI